ncbi:DUF1697 domain-containing protein [Zunongwangia endophytica]|uniref:DUF1697 domain-containing protein n=1 Tax=Zunongwangia endophytica TaxID=1808945 RepID=A0ABV8HAS3_9FLAO|nr:DUF1697 domain-containing protein [Zunongwangia endophytica]MDN3593898.1 DUF1697 domain-containing protein [Zunongwangia endophytica]
MGTSIAILKGINVGGHKKIKMAELRDLLSEEGLLENIKTYIQSGNIIFNSSEYNTATLEHFIQKKIKAHYGFEVQTIVISAKNLQYIINENPFSEIDIKRLHCCFFKSEPIIQNRQKLEIFDASPDQFKTAKDCVYICCATERYSQARINNSVAEKILKINCTTRNWKTCLKLIEIADAL